MKVYMEVYGCSANIADFEIISGLLRKAGFQLVSQQMDSDINIIVTCVVKTPTEQRMVHKIKKLQRLSKPIVIAGCMPKAERELAENIAPQASLLGPNSIQKVVDVVKKTLEKGRTVFLNDLDEPKVCLPKIRRNPIINIVPISEGCAWQRCTYCITKFARSRLFSYPIDLITKEIKQSIREGCREIWLTGQDTGAYGLDKGTDLVELLNKIYEIEGKFFVRVGMMNPIHLKELLHGLIKNFKKRKIFNFIHLPVQSGDDEVLKLMNRPYSVEDFKQCIYSFREAIPKITIATDIICGFPYESEQAFTRSIELIREIKPDVLNISRFYPRPKTLSRAMKQLPVEKIKERSSKMTKVFYEISSKKNRAWIGWKGEILVDEKGRCNSWIGRNFAYKPIVLKRNEFLHGKFMSIQVKKAFPTYLVANNP